MLCGYEPLVTAGGLKVTLRKEWREGRENPPFATVTPSQREKARKTRGPLIRKEEKGVHKKKASIRTEQLSPRIGSTSQKASRGNRLSHGPRARPSNKASNQCPTAGTSSSMAAARTENDACFTTTRRCCRPERTWLAQKRALPPPRRTRRREGHTPRVPLKNGVPLGRPTTAPKPTA